MNGAYRAALDAIGVLSGMLIGAYIKGKRESKGDMALLSRDAIREVNDAQYEDIEVPEWGGTVRVRGMSGTQRDAYEASIIDQRGAERKVVLANARAKLVQRCLVDESGVLMFTADDVRMLGSKSASALERVFDKARELSGMSERDVEKLTENLDGDPSDDATSD